MASSSSSKTCPEKKYDVFLSFRGDDTRKSFTSHLYAALTRRNVRTYIDYELERGDEISHALVKAIEDAKLYVIIFSENYASSTWCLDEAMKIMECRRDHGKIIVPVFYGVNPCQVRHQTGSFAAAFAKHEQRFKDNIDKIRRWRLALVEAADLSGWDCFNRIESELIEEIASDVLQKLDELNDDGLEVKSEKSPPAGTMADIGELLATLMTLADLKLQKT